MTVHSAMEISATGLKAQRVRMETIAKNIANAESTRTSEGGPYQRKQVVLAATSSPSEAGAVPGQDEGVKVVGIVTDPTPPNLVYDPSHPDADAAGYVAYPNVNVVMEMVDLMSASRAYEANVTAVNAAKAMTAKALEIGR